MPLGQEGSLYDNANNAFLCSRNGVVLAGAWGCLCGACVSLFRCLALVVGAAGGAAGVVYVMGKLQDEMSYEVSVVHKATVAALAELELKLLEDKADKLSAHVESEFSDGEHVWIDLKSISDSRTSLTIRVGVTGNEVRARKIYDAIKRHLS